MRGFQKKINKCIILNCICIQFVGDAKSREETTGQSYTRSNFRPQEQEQEQDCSEVIVISCIVSSRVSKTQSRIPVSLQLNSRLKNSSPRSRSRNFLKNKLFLTLFTKMWAGSMNSLMKRMMTQKTQCVPTSSKASAKRARNVYTRTISLWTEMKISICTLTREPS